MDKAKVGSVVTLRSAPHNVREAGPTQRPAHAIDRGGMRRPPHAATRKLGAVIMVTEKPSRVLACIADARNGRAADSPFIELTPLEYRHARRRWEALAPFHTRYDNIANVEAPRYG